MSSSSDDDYERTLCQLPQVHVFRIPVRKSAEGHRAADWPTEPAWTGKLKIVSKGRVAAIVLLDDKNQVFANCQVTDDAAVERTLDSGRYFVLRISNAQGKKAFIGIAFNERNDAFDFNVALAEFKSECEREDQAAKLFVSANSEPAKDLRIKEGEKIKIKIVKKSKVPEEEEEDSSTSTSSPRRTGKIGFLVPPRSVPVSIPVTAPVPAPVPGPVSAPVSKPTSFFDNDPFGDFSAATPPVRTGAGTDPFGSNDPFGSTDPFASFSINNNTTKTNNNNNKTKSDVTNLLDL